MQQHLAQQNRSSEATDQESLQSFFLARESNPPTPLQGLDRWSADELLCEVVRRSADDVPALRTAQEHVLRAILTAIDRDALGPGTQAPGQSRHRR